MSNPKSDRLVLAAKKRAAILGVLNSSPIPMAAPDILKDSVVKSFKFTTVSLAAFLATMKKSKLIDSVKYDYPDHPKVKVGYACITSTKAKAAVKAAKSGKEAKAPKAKKHSGNKPNFVVDYIRSTGRVRIELDDLFVEIGIINS
jgi:hypothetical protein